MADCACVLTYETGLTVLEWCVCLPEAVEGERLMVDDEDVFVDSDPVVVT